VLISVEPDEQAGVHAEEKILGGTFQVCFQVPGILAGYRFAAFDVDVGIKLAQLQVPMNVRTPDHVGQITTRYLRESMSWVNLPGIMAIAYKFRRAMTKDLRNGDEVVGIFEVFHGCAVCLKIRKFKATPQDHGANFLKFAFSTKSGGEVLHNFVYTRDLRIQ
jgi:hypothetical protein